MNGLAVLPFVSDDWVRRLLWPRHQWRQVQVNASYLDGIVRIRLRDPAPFFLVAASCRDRSSGSAAGSGVAAAQAELERAAARRALAGIPGPAEPHKTSKKILIVSFGQFRN